MTDINENDDYIHRLVKIVPIYIMPFITTSVAVFKIFTNPVIQAMAFLVLLIGSLILIYTVEFRNQKVTRIDQKLIVIISTILYIIIVGVNSFIELTDIGTQIYGIFILIVIFWTFVAPYYIPKSSQSETDKPTPNQ